MSYVFTSESVSPGHPDKTCDQISDLLLDHVLSHEPDARCAFECFATKDNMIIGGEVRVRDVSIVLHSVLEQKIREHLKYIGHTTQGFLWSNVPIKFIFHEQSTDIAIGVDENEGKDEGAGDQGIMFGYACNETQNFLPASIHYSHRILEAIWDAGKSGKIKNLGPDAKSQVSLLYNNDGTIAGVDSVTLSIQHHESLSLSDVKAAVLPIIASVLPNNQLPSNQRIFINPTGRFTIGGPVSDAGLTGRKIIVDTYGGHAPHGGGAFSGKDPTKVDRSAAYIARYLAKNIVAAGLADKCVIQLSYVIGVSYPISVFIDFYGTKKTTASNDEIVAFLRSKVNLTPKGIRTYLGLNKPIYLKTATFGHFGRDYDPKTGHFSWEKLDLTPELKSKFG